MILSVEKLGRKLQEAMDMPKTRTAILGNEALQMINCQAGRVIKQFLDDCGVCDDCKTDPLLIKECDSCTVSTNAVIFLTVGDLPNQPYPV